MYPADRLLHLINAEIENIQLKENPTELYEPIKYFLSLGGKRIRPLLVLLSCDMFGGKVEDALKPAVAVEVFHNFTLLHDDLMDRAPLRRSKKTVHEKWNAEIAILSGDAMFVKSLQLISTVDKSILKKCLDLFLITAEQVCEGQQFDINFEKEINVSVDEYLNMIELKTAVLIAFSLSLGALIAEADQEDVASVYEFGKNLGISFQLQDDLLDVYGDEKFGKLTGGDIVANKKTFLLLSAFESSTQNVKSNLIELFSGAPDSQIENKIEKVKTIYDEAGVREKTEEKLRHYTELAFNSLKKIKVKNERKSELTKLAERLIIRGH